MPQLLSLYVDEKNVDLMNEKEMRLTASLLSVFCKQTQAIALIC